MYQKNRFAVPLGMHGLRVINAYEIITPISDEAYKVFLQQVHQQQKCPSVFALVIKYTIRMAKNEGKSICDL